MCTHTYIDNIFHIVHWANILSGFELVGLSYICENIFF